MSKSSYELKSNNRLTHFKLDLDYEEDIGLDIDNLERKLSTEDLKNTGNELDRHKLDVPIDHIIDNQIHSNVGNKIDKKLDSEIDSKLDCKIENQLDSKIDSPSDNDRFIPSTIHFSFPVSTNPTEILQFSR